MVRCLLDTLVSNDSAFHLYIVAGLACLNGLALAQLPAQLLSQELAAARSGNTAHQSMGRTSFESDKLKRLGFCLIRVRLPIIAKLNY